MKLLGVDFDNTLVLYDKIFHQLALEKNLIPQNFSISKKKIRNYLRSIDQDSQFTLLQAEAYGSRICEAEMAPGAMSALLHLKSLGIEIALISHKTQFPHKGPKYDLHESALRWLHKNGFMDQEGLSWNRENIYFEETREKKIQRIKSLGCSHFIDDLPEVLIKIPANTVKFLYDPESNTELEGQKLYQKITRWGELEKIALQ